MTDAALSPAETPPKGGLRKLLPILLVFVMLGGGFASTFLGLWSPMALLKPSPAHETPEAAVPETQFVSLPQIALTLAGPQMRMLVMAVQIETDAAHKPAVEHLRPRLSDAFNSFLADIAPSAFEKRGILDIIRDELATRAVFVLGKDAFSDILITEFRIQ
ncbi:MAG: flagellar basal body-associated FliL family protein [Paracoccus sp. (in: a-proteobacteria)]|uniref:flagellar basal body-associated FliL family protein n=1 Tax=Paracoccus sp. TaxID=267 RepID=UPI0039E540A1